MLLFFFSVAFLMPLPVILMAKFESVILFDVIILWLLIVKLKLLTSTIRRMHVCGQLKKERKIKCWHFTLMKSPLIQSTMKKNRSASLLSLWFAVYASFPVHRTPFFMFQEYCLKTLMCRRKYYQFSFVTSCGTSVRCHFFFGLRCYSVKSNFCNLNVSFFCLHKC